MKSFLHTHPQNQSSATQIRSPGQASNSLLTLCMQKVSLHLRNKMLVVFLCHFFFSLWLSVIFLTSGRVNKCIQPYLCEKTYVPISAAGNHVYTCTEVAQEQYVLVKLLPVPSLSPPTSRWPRPGRAEAVWPQGWNNTSATCLDAADLFV